MKNKVELWGRVSIIISGLLTIIGSLMPFLTIHMNLFGKQIYTKQVGIRSLSDSNMNDFLNKLNSLGVQKIDEMLTQVKKMIFRPICLFGLLIILAIIIVISSLINKLAMIRVELSILMIALEVYLFFFIQKFPTRLYEALNMSELVETMNMSDLIVLEVVTGFWLMLVATICMAVASVVCLIWKGKKGSVI